MLTQLVLSAICLVAPVDGPVLEGFAPVGSYGGHWGIDYGVPFGSEVGAPGSGRVTFAGSVAGMRTVTIEPVPGFKVSVSYLSEIVVETGQSVERSQIVGRSGSPHGVDGVHLSTRIDGRYVDPESQLGCRETDITRALRLVTPPAPYPRRSAHRHTRRDLRPDSSGPPPRRRDRTVPRTAGPGVAHAGWGSVAEG